jgi:hypothetical protein
VTEEMKNRSKIWTLSDTVTVKVQFHPFHPRKSTKYPDQPQLLLSSVMLSPLDVASLSSSSLMKMELFGQLR